jgi:hypothetical protein
MSKAEHARGPWEAWFLGKGSTLAVTGPAAAAAMCCKFALRADLVSKDDPCIEIAASDKTAPALVFGDTLAQCEANARLIASAPELLALLVQLNDAIDRLGHGSYSLESRDGFDAQLFVDEVRAAIARATGSNA